MKVIEDFTVSYDLMKNEIHVTLPPISLKHEKHFLLLTCVDNQSLRRLRTLFYTVPKTLEILIYDTGPRIRTTIEFLMMFAFQYKETDHFLSVILRSGQLFKDTVQMTTQSIKPNSKQLSKYDSCS